MAKKVQILAESLTGLGNLMRRVPAIWPAKAPKFPRVFGEIPESYINIFRSSYCITLCTGMAIVAVGVEEP